jgi:hypothetical protein
MKAMKPSSEDHARLEQIITSGLRRQPTLKAPASLQARVLAELARRAALPWWHRSFRQWPMMMQIAFVLTALGAVRLTLSVTAWSDAGRAATQIAAPVRGQLSLVETLGSLWVSFGSLVGNLGRTLLHHVPSVWLVVAAFVAVSMYAMLAGIGVTIFRTLDNASARA